jgi:ubiquinone biosynthesis monooxygenase Coq7
VESVIERHYAGQVAEIAPEDPPLAKTLEQFRQDEVGHHDEAVASGARDAPGYPVLTAVIRLGCRAAIRISEKL